MSKTQWIVKDNLGDFFVFLGMNYPIVGVGPQIDLENEILPMLRNDFVYICSGLDCMHDHSVDTEADVCQFRFDGQPTVGFQLKQNGWGVPDSILWFVPSLKNVKDWNMDHLASMKEN